MKYIITLVIIIAGIWGLTYLNKDTSDIEIITGRYTSITDSTASAMDAMEKSTTTTDTMMEKDSMATTSSDVMKKQ